MFYFYSFKGCATFRNWKTDAIIHKYVSYIKFRKMTFVQIRSVSSVQVHRVIIPEAPSEREKVRMSVAYFLLPDRGCLVQCLDGSDKYEPIKSIDFLNMRLAGERDWEKKTSTTVDVGSNRSQGTEGQRVINQNDTKKQKY